MTSQFQTDFQTLSYNLSTSATTSTLLTSTLASALWIGFSYAEILVLSKMPDYPSRLLLLRRAKLLLYSNVKDQIFQVSEL